MVSCSNPTDRFRGKLTYLIFCLLVDVMARTTISNVEFMARAKTRRKPEESFEAVAACLAGPVAPFADPTREHDASTGASGIGDMPLPQVLKVPPITTIPTAEGGKAKRKKKNKGVVSIGRSPKWSK